MSSPNDAPNEEYDSPAESNSARQRSKTLLQLQNLKNL